MSNIQSIFETMNYWTADTVAGKAKEAGIDFATNALTGFIPAPIRQSARGMDPFYRDMSGETEAERSWNSWLAALPGARQILPEKLDNFGQPKTYTGNPLLDVMNALV
jgi:hypothetical protein